MSLSVSSLKDKCLGEISLKCLFFDELALRFVRDVA